MSFKIIEENLNEEIVIDATACASLDLKTSKQHSPVKDRASKALDEDGFESFCQIGVIGYHQCVRAAATSRNGE